MGQPGARPVLRVHVQTDAPHTVGVRQAVRRGALPIFVDAEHLRTILEAMRGEVLTAEDALVVLDGRRYPFDVNDGSDTCWSIQTSRIARDCLQ